MLVSVSAARDSFDPFAYSYRIAQRTKYDLVDLRHM